MRRALSLFIGMLLLLLLAGCGDEVAKDDKHQLVKTQVVSLGAQEVAQSYSGVIRGRYETNMAFQVGGRIISRNVQLGDKVFAGQVLMVIDARDVIQQANQGDAQVAAAKAQLDLARVNLQRYRELYAQEAVPASVLDQHETSYEAALASYESAMAQAVQGHNALGYTNLASDADGVISAISAEVGQVVGAGQPVVTVTQDDELEVEYNVPENQLSEMYIGKEVAVQLWANKGDTVTGIVREISPVADNTARTFKVRVSLPDLPAGIQLGMTAKVMSFVQGNTAANAAILPLSAIYQTGNTPQVWMVNKDSMTLELKDVQVGAAEGNKVQVQGLSHGDVVVIAGVHKLRVGEKVRLMDGEQP